ncbi:MAG: hypothetical protein KAR11_04795 [Phycisphaerae bacterium]|nr:hypothetical protein [Phycisphaerae bacterium]
MPVMSRLFRVGSISQSMSIYLPASFLQLVLAMGRVLVFTYLITRDQMGVWGTGAMIFVVGAPLVCLGSNHALVRYVSVYEARKKLKLFFRRMRIFVPLLTCLLIGVTFACSKILISKVIYPQGHGEIASYQWQVGLAVIGNLGFMALYLCMLSFIYGLRVYALASLVEVLFAILFTATAVVWLSVGELGATLTMLLAHLGSLVVVVSIGMTLLWICVNRIAKSPPIDAQTTPDIEPTADDGDMVKATIPVVGKIAPQLDEYYETLWEGLLRFVKFGLAGMIGALLWQVSGYVSFTLVYQWSGQQSGGVFHVMNKLTQPLVVLAGAAWAVVFSHVAKQWETDKKIAMETLELSFKAIALTVMTFTIAIYAFSPLWIKLLDARYQEGLAYLPGLFTLAVGISNLTMLTIPAKLHERPIIIGLGAVSGVALNILLAALWMPRWGEAGAALAAGVGMYFGGGIVMFVYLLASKVNLRDSSYFILALPVMLLLPVYILVPVWLVILATCIFSPWIFTKSQKTMLRTTAVNRWRGFRGMLK